MKRLRRVVWNGLTAVTALLFIAAVALLTQSYIRGDTIAYTNSSNRYILVTCQGRFALLRQESQLFSKVEQGWRWTHPGRTSLGAESYWIETIVKQPRVRQLLGFSWGELPNVASIFTGSILPIALSLVILPVLWAAGALLRKRAARRSGLCSACGYDLRATAERCPECGMVPRENPSN